MITINIPTSKSYAQRIILVSIFSGIETIIQNIDYCDDIKSTLDILYQFNSKYEILDNGDIYINTTKYPLDFNIKNINVNESGTLCRILIPILSNYQNEFNINGQGTLLNRDLSDIENFFNLSYIKFITNNGKLPITICGKNNEFILYHYGYTFDCTNTSQYLSGIIISYALKNENNVFIQADNVYSIDYVKITIDVLNKFGYDIYLQKLEREDSYIILIYKVDLLKDKLYINVEGDWSSAASIILYNIINKPNEEIHYKNLNLLSTQSDTKIFNLIYKFCDIYECDDYISIKKKTELNDFVFDCSHCPDLFPVVCTLAATNKNGCSEIIGLDKLVNKESNRGKVILKEFRKYGINVIKIHNSLFIQGTDSYNYGVEYNSHNDHRIAMALIILRKYYNDIIPTEDKCLNKSYPNFIKDINE